MHRIIEFNRKLKCCGKENKNLPQSNSTVDTSKDDKTSNSSSDDIDF